MKRLSYKDSGFESSIGKTAGGSSLFDPVIEERVRGILDAVRERGDAALAELTRRFDGADLTPDQFAVSRAEHLAAAATVGEEIRAAAKVARVNIERFSRGSLRRAWKSKNVQGAEVGEKFDAFDRVGIYIPGGTAPLVSTALMTVTLARVAGCAEIVVCTPCASDGRVNPALLYAARAAGATEVYRLGGAQAVAAMAFGTQTVRPVRKVFGPGNAYVVCAKRLLFGRVAVDLLPGPSEVLVLADDSARADYVAADLLAQAEHGSGHERVWVVSNSARLLRAVEVEIQRQLPRLARRAFIERALDQNGWLVRVRDMEQGAWVANQLAPEHCQVMTRRPEGIIRRVVTAGAIFVGPYSPTVAGDYVAGPSHELPTGGAGASFAGLTVDQFQRRTSVVKYGRVALKKSLGTIRAFAAIEGLDAHGRSAAIRFGN